MHLSLGTVKALEDYRLREALRRGLREAPTQGLMFCQPTGKPLSRHGEVSQFESLLEKAQLSRRTPHDIRHTTASIMIAEGASILQVQHQMRHATPTVTLNTYGHLMPSDRRSGFGETNGGLTPPLIPQTGTDE
jgi:integrase